MFKGCDLALSMNKNGLWQAQGRKAFFFTFFIYTNLFILYVFLFADWGTYLFPSLFSLPFGLSFFSFFYCRTLLYIYLYIFVSLLPFIYSVPLSKYPLLFYLKATTLFKLVFVWLLAETGQHITINATDMMNQSIASGYWHVPPQPQINEQQDEEHRESTVGVQRYQSQNLQVRLRHRTISPILEHESDELENFNEGIAGFISKLYL
jgi:hypothetical protein